MFYWAICASKKPLTIFSGDLPCVLLMFENAYLRQNCRLAKKQPIAKACPRKSSIRMIAHKPPFSLPQQRNAFPQNSRGRTWRGFESFDLAGVPATHPTPPADHSSSGRDSRSLTGLET